MVDSLSLISTIEANCDSIFTPEALELIREVLGYFRILAPIALIILTAVDYGGAVLSGDKDLVAKANGKVVKRAIATLCVFFVPTFVNLALDLASLEGISSNYMCSTATGTEAKKAVASTSGKHNSSKPSVNLNNGVVNNNGNGSGNSNGGNGSGNSNGGNGSGNSNGGNGNSGNGNNTGGGNGNSQSGNSPSIGNHANVENTVCLKNQSGLRDRYQSELESKIRAAGYNTRNGVVAAAIYISSEIGIRVPYFPGGCHSMSCLKKGIPSNLGCQTNVVHNAHKWPATLPGGFDCSGFTFWAYGMAFGTSSTISSEMHNYSNSSTKVYDPSKGKSVSVRVERVDITNNNISYIKNLLMPGDLVGTDGHVGMVISTSRLQSEGIYTVAHASSASMQVSVQDYKLAPKNKWGQVVLMRKFFLKYDCLNRNDKKSCQNFDCINSKSCNSNNIRY